MAICLIIHQKAHSKVYTILGIIFVLSLINFICFIVNRAIVLNKLDYYEENDPDIIITGLSKVQFLEKKMPEEYKVSEPNLGSTGKINFDCFRGECNFLELGTCYKSKCSGSGKHRTCRSVPYKCYIDDYKFYYDCLYECRTKGQLICNSCPNRAESSIGSCSRNENDDYDSQKSCLADNVVYNWKGHYYYRVNSTSFYGELSYLKNAVQANESCPTSMKMCGILDELDNKLCIPKTKDCPINYIKVSNNSLDEKYNYKFSDFGNKKIYYTNEAVSEKIIGGLYVDSDLLIQYKDEECEILDTESISELINDNKKLYRNVLDFDPYSETNINNKGKSYLKWCIVEKGRIRDLNIMKKENITFNFNKTINLNLVQPIKKNIGYYNYGITGFIFIIIFLIIFLFTFFRINETGINIFCWIPVNFVMCIFTLFLFLFFSSIYFFIKTSYYLLGNNDILFQNKEINLNFIDSLIDLNRFILLDGYNNICNDFSSLSIYKYNK